LLITVLLDDLSVPAALKRLETISREYGPAYADAIRKALRAEQARRGLADEPRHPPANPGGGRRFGQDRNKPG
jgi:hypothetical protein